MSTTISIEIEVDDEYADPDHSTGMTNEGYEKLMSAIASFGDVVAGPDLII